MYRYSAYWVVEIAKQLNVANTAVMHEMHRARIIYGLYTGRNANGKNILYAKNRN